MDSQPRLLFLAALALGSLLWGIRDLMRKRAETGLAFRVQSWAQVAAGLIGLGFVLSVLAAR